MLASKYRIACATALVLVAVVLRVVSFQWNERLQGDVNLFALTARQFVQTGELAYPIKYEFSDRVDYCSKRSAASQHPPLLPLAAGLLGWAIGSDLTYPLLKILSELGGMILVLTVVARVSSCGGPGTLLALALVAGSPALVDFSGNGSPYVWSGLLLLASTLLVPRVAAGRTRDFAATGLLSGVAPQIHFALLAIPVSFVLSGLIRWRRLSVGPVLAFCGAAAVVTAPWVAWNLRHFGAPWYSYAPSVFWTNLGLAREGIHGDVVTWWWKDASWLDMASVALRNTYGSTPAVLDRLVREAGPGALVLAVIAAVTILRVDLRGGLERLLPGLVYLAFVLPFEFRDRFVVPLLPLAYLAAGHGYGHLWRSGRRWVAGGCGVLALLWMVPGYFESPPTRLYADDATHRDWYEAMVPVARRLALLEPGPTLGFSATLDRGIEAAYYHRQFLIRARTNHPPGEPEPRDLVRKLARDFRARYVWADRFTRLEVVEIFPDARAVLGNGSYFVFELPRRQSGPGVCD